MTMEGTREAQKDGDNSSEEAVKGSDAVHHREVDAGHRTTVVSLNSMVFHLAAAVGAIVLTTIAAGTSLSTAMVVAGIACAVAAPLYIPAFRAEQQRPEAGVA